MSVEYEGDDPTLEIEVDDPTQEMPVVNSLEQRMQKRSSELEQQVTDVFDVPGWEDVIAVELRLLGWQRLRAIGHKNRKIKQQALLELYTAVDQLIAATEGFYEVAGERRTPIQESWVTLAKRTGKPLPEDLTQRQAVIALVGDVRIMSLYSEWQEWMSGERRNVDEEVMRDFETTGSPSSRTTR